MFAAFDVRPDILVMQALQYIHCFDMTFKSEDHRLIGRGWPGEYVRTLAQVADDFEGWVGRCAAHDADPEGWVQTCRRDAEAYVRGAM